MITRVVLGQKFIWEGSCSRTPEQLTCLVGNNTSSIGEIRQIIIVYKSVESESDYCEAKPVFYSVI